MEYEPSEYKDNVYLNPFVDEFYDTKIPLWPFLIAV